MYSMGSPKAGGMSDKAGRIGMAKVFLHIGMNKTGSSALQRYFSQNKEILGDLGVLWPDFGLGEGHHYTLSTTLGFGDPNAEGQDEASRHSLRAALDGEIAKCGARTVVISSESFVKRRDLSALSDFFEGLDTYVVAYLRRHDAWWPSLFAQAIKTVSKPPWRRNFQSYYEFQRKRESQYFAFGELFDDMSGIFGRDRIIACPYERGQNQPNLIAHFLDQIGEPRLAGLVPPSEERVNAALSVRSLSLIDLVQRADIPSESKDQIIKTIKAEDPGDRSAELVPAGVRRKLAMDQADDYARIAREYLGRADGRLFHDPLPEGGDEDDIGTLPFPKAVEFFSPHFEPDPNI